MNISFYYNLNKTQKDLDFVDIKLHSDNETFIDPRLIEKFQSDNIHIKKMNKSLMLYWIYFLYLFSKKKLAEVYKHLEFINEQEENHLGYSKGSNNGRYIGNKSKTHIIDSIINNKAITTGAIKSFTDFDLIVSYFGPDSISDFTTSIIFEDLLDYTNDQIKIQNIKVDRVVKEKFIYNPKTHRWENKELELPAIDGKTFILTPKCIVRSKNSANSNMSIFYRYLINGLIIKKSPLLENIIPTGKYNRLLKKDIKMIYPLSKSTISDLVTIDPEALKAYNDSVLKDNCFPIKESELYKIVYQLPESTRLAS